MRVLIVEDEPVIALEIEAIVLDRLPHAEIVMAHSVSDALAAIREGRPVLAFLDIDVTDGKTYPLALELRASRVPFVFVSGADRSDAPEGLDHERMVSKPFSPQILLKQLEDLVARGASVE